MDWQILMSFTVVIGKIMHAIGIACTTRFQGLGINTSTVRSNADFDNRGKFSDGGHIRNFV